MNQQRLTYAILAISLSLILLTIAALPARAQAPDPIAGIDAYIQKALTDWGIPGLAIAIVRNDQVIFSKGYGVREVGKPEPVDENTLFAIGSATKAFTAASVGMLVDEGKMKWNDPLTKYLPRLKFADPYLTQNFTLRDALSHRSGLAAADLLWVGWSYRPQEMLRRIQFMQPRGQFRSTFEYQNLMYLAAGQALEAAGKQPWGNLLESQILAPLGMTSTLTTTTGLAGMSDVAMPHILANGALQTIPYRNIDNVAPAGALNSNVVDMAQWVRFWLNNGKVGDKQLLSTDAVKEMESPQTIIRLDEPTPYAVVYSYANFLDYGLGWFLSDYSGHKIYDHGGNIDGMSALVSLMPEQQLGMVILTNLNQTPLPTALALKIYDSFLQELPEWDWSQLYKAGFDVYMQQEQAAGVEFAKTRNANAKPSLPLNRYTGDFENALYGRMTITEANGKLQIETPRGRIKGDLTPWNRDSFAVTWTNLQAINPGPMLLDFNAAQGMANRFSVKDVGTFRRTSPPIPAERSRAAKPAATPAPEGLLPAVTLTPVMTITGVVISETRTTPEGTLPLIAVTPLLPGAELTPISAPPPATAAPGSETSPGPEATAMPNQNMPRSR